jgi:hypothetical protein
MVGYKERNRQRDEEDFKKAREKPRVGLCLAGSLKLLLF